MGRPVGAGVDVDELVARVGGEVPALLLERAEAARADRPAQGEVGHHPAEERLHLGAAAGEQGPGAVGERGVVLHALQPVRVGVVADVLAIELGAERAAEELRVLGRGERDRRLGEEDDLAALERVGEVARAERRERVRRDGVEHGRRCSRFGAAPMKVLHLLASPLLDRPGGERRLARARAARAGARGLGRDRPQAPDRSRRGARRAPAAGARAARRARPRAVGEVFAPGDARGRSPARADPGRRRPRALHARPLPRALGRPRGQGARALGARGPVAPPLSAPGRWLHRVLLGRARGPRRPARGGAPSAARSRLRSRGGPGSSARGARALRSARDRHGLDLPALAPPRRRARGLRAAPRRAPRRALGARRRRRAGARDPGAGRGPRPLGCGDLRGLSLGSGVRPLAPGARRGLGARPRQRLERPGRGAGPRLRGPGGRRRRGRPRAERRRAPPHRRPVAARGRLARDSRASQPLPSNAELAARVLALYERCRQ